MSSRTRRSWTAREDALLRQLVRKELDNSRPVLWREVAKSIPGRSNKDCRKRWWNSLVGGTAKGAWSPDEDRKLIDAVDKYGTNNWSRVASDVGTRSGDQCSSHWRQVLNPNINYCDWTKEEDDHLLDAVRVCGTNWSTIASFHVPERTTLALKNRYWKLRMQNQNPLPETTKTGDEEGEDEEGDEDDDEDDDSEGDIRQLDVNMDGTQNHAQDRSRWPQSDWSAEATSSPSEPQQQKQVLDAWAAPAAGMKAPRSTGYNTPVTPALTPVDHHWMDGMVDPALISADTPGGFGQGGMDLGFGTMSGSDMFKRAGASSHTSSPATFPSDPAMWDVGGAKESAEAVAKAAKAACLHRISFTASCTTDQLSNIMSVLATQVSDVQIKIETP